MINAKTKLSFPLFLTLLSFALNLHALAADSFWGDEILTASFAGRSPTEVIRWTAKDIHPPLYYLLAGAFTRLTIPLGSSEQPGPISDWLWRFPSVIAVVFSVAVTYQLAYYVVRSTYSPSCLTFNPPHTTHHALRPTPYALRPTHHAPRTTHYALRFTLYVPLFAALLLTFSPLAIKYGQEARMHALFMLLSALSTWLMLRAMNRPRQWNRWLAFSLAAAAGLYTMYFGFLILASQTILLLSITNYQSVISKSSRFTFHPGSAKPPRGTAPKAGVLPWQCETSPWDSAQGRRFTRFTASVALAFLLYLPWWPILFEILRKRAAAGAIEGGVGNPGAFMVGVIKALGPDPAPAAWLFLGLFIGGLFFLARQHRPLAIFAGSWLILPAALPIVLGDPRALQFRYAFILPIYLTVIAYAVLHLASLLELKFPIFSQPPNLPISQPPNLPISQSPNLPISQSPNLPTFQPSNLPTYLLWILITLSFIATLDIYQLVKPNWREAAAYLDQHTSAADVIIIGPLWDEGRFIDYYYRGQAQLLTPAALVTNIERRAQELRKNGGRVWAVNRFAPHETPALKNISFGGVVISEPRLVVYEPAILTEAAIDLAAQAVEAAYPWAAAAKAQGILDPDPRTAQAAALRALGDTLMAAGRPREALKHYQRAVDIFPGWADGFIALAEAYQAVGNLPAAVEAYRQAVAYNLKWQGPAAGEAAILAQAGQWEIALKKYRLIIGD